LKTQLQEEGIKPGSDLKELMDEAGIGPVGGTSETEGVQGIGGMMQGAPPPPPPPPPDDETSSSETEYPEELTDFLEKLNSGEATDEDVTTLIEWLESEGFTLTGNLINEDA
jgi:hypothetical protein